MNKNNLMGDDLKNKTSINHFLLIMRTAIILLFTCVFISVAETGYTQNDKITLNKNKAALKDVLNEIENQTDYLFIYNNEVNTNKTVSVKTKNEAVSKVLNRVLKDSDISFLMEGNHIILSHTEKQLNEKNNEKTETIQQQGKTITGTITDAQGESIIGANIIEKGTRNGTITDIDGNFTLRVNVNATLVVTYIGYTTREIKTQGKQSLEIVLTDDTELLEEVVVIGYSSQRKETLTGAISTVSSDDLLSATNANVSNSLVGRVPGISSTQASGEAGDNASSIRIRGVATLNSSGREPLIVVDGIQSSAEIMNAIDPHEIESISVLKDASSTAVYGVKGANGVIILTTKRGSSSSPKINFTYRYGLSRLTSKLKMVDSYDYAVFRNEAIENDMIESNYQFLFTKDELWKFKNNRDYTPAEVEGMSLSEEDKLLLNNSPALYYRNDDYVDQVFGGIAPQSQYNINMSGGGDRFNYFMSLGRFAEDGILNNTKHAGKDVNSKYERYNIRSNIDVDVHKNLKLSLDFGAQFTDKDATLAAEGTSRYNRYREIWNSIFHTPAGLGGPGVLDGKMVTGFSHDTNPLANKGSIGQSPMTNMLWKPMLQTRTSNMNITGKLDFDLSFLLDGLSLSGTLSYNDTYTKGTRHSKHIPEYTISRNPENPTEVLFFGGSQGPYSISDNLHKNKWNRFYVESKLFYSKTFDKHAITGLLLYNLQTTKYPSLQYNVPQNLIGTAGRVTYAYDNKYLGEFNMGYNGSENFPEGNRFGFFPSLSAGWIISEEAFFPEAFFISWLKLRGSYGLVGNDQIGGDRFLYLPSSWRSGWNGLLGGYAFGNTNGSYRDPHYSGYMEDDVGNPNVTWEKAKKINLGVDLYFFDNKLTFIGDYFEERRDNILWRLGTVPGIVAADLAPANIGEVDNKGYELSLGWKDRIQDFHYGATFNLSYAKNKIKYMDEPSFPYEWMNTTGFSLDQYKGLNMDGFYNNQDEVFNRPYVEFDGNLVTQGDVKYVDVNGDGVINSQDQTPLGYPNLPLYSFSSNIYLSYKGFSLNLLFNGSRHGSILMNSLYISNPFYTIHHNAFQYQFDGRWTPEKVEQGITPTFPRASVRTFDSQNGRVNDIWLYSTDFMRLKNAELAYTFRDIGKLKRIGLSGIKIYTNGTNLLTWGTKLIDGYDPEQMATIESGQGFLFPPTSTYNFGINLQF